MTDSHLATIWQDAADQEVVEDGTDVEFASQIFVESCFLATWLSLSLAMTVSSS